MNHAPARVAAAIAVIASAAVSAGLASPRACEGFAMEWDVTIISLSESVLACASGPVEPGEITGECFVSSMTPSRPLAPGQNIRLCCHGRGRAELFRRSAPHLFGASRT